MQRRSFLLGAAMLAIATKSAGLSAEPQPAGTAHSGAGGFSDQAVIPAEGTVEILFAPTDDTTGAVVRFIGEANHSIRVAAYAFTSNDVGRALVAASRRGVDVRVVLDRQHNGRRRGPNSVARYLASNGIPVRVDARVPIQHSKVIIIDGRHVQNGSWNFSKQAERNAENITICRDCKRVAEAFLMNWDHLWQESTPFAEGY